MQWSEGGDHEPAGPSCGSPETHQNREFVELYQNCINTI